MSDYSAMSDFEINHAVAKLISLKLQSVSSLLYNKTGNWEIFDPCNNPADAWPIIMANKISLMFDRSLEDGCNAEWCLASSPCDQIIVDHVIPDKILRAAMIVFLMMKESSHA
ncbi:phage protein NinX family protein [Yersinia massiliensis]|uniref:phage protein NinX family protein n=1 Tax=Yersinia massiliensis TaxID=419257 RepID=UPI0005B62B7C|nr:phage protein NinX family protein [Yersinia massiliensis]